MRRNLRPGFTLVELLVVIFVVLLITAVAIKTMAPDSRTRKLREAARMVNSALATARSRAIETGRPYGVAMEIDPQQGNPSVANRFGRYFARAVHFVEIPQPYAGDSINDSFAVITSPPPGQIAPTGQVVVGLNHQGNPYDSGFTNLVRVGDWIQFNSQGHLYEITGPSDAQGHVNGATWNIRPLRINGQPASIAGVRNPGAPMTYRVYRRPVKAAAPSVELPEGFVIDLSVSGFGPIGQEAMLGGMILFSPNGSLELAIGPTGAAVPPQPLFLMIGEQRGVLSLTGPSGAPPNTPLAPDSYNLGDFTTFWVCVNHQTGLVTTVENMGGPNHDPAGPSLNLAGARARGLLMQTMGGR